MADQKFWTRPEEERIFQLMTDREDGTHAIRMEAYPPKVLMTDGDGQYARLRVDAGQTGFFAGREFRVFSEFTLTANQSIYYKLNCTLVQTIVQFMSVQAWDGSARVELLAEGGTEGGTFNNVITPRRTNRMTTADLTYSGQVTFSSGGTYTGGVVAEVFELETSVGSGHHHEAVDDVRPYGLPVGSYYIKVTAGSNGARGAINIRYEERP